MTPPRLLHFRISHYNEKVRWALDFKKLPHVREALVPVFHVPRVRMLTGQQKVPVLVVDGKPLVGSAHIIDELERRQPEPALYPASAADRERALEIQKYFDEEVAPDVRRLFWSTYLPHPAMAATVATGGASAAKRIAWRTGLPIFSPVFRRNIGLNAESLVTSRQRTDAHFDRLERELQPSGYLVGDSFGLADLAAAAILSAIVRPPEFSYPLPEPYPPELVALQAELSSRRGYRWVQEMYARHRGPSCEISG